MRRKGKYKEEEMEALQKEAEEVEEAALKEQPSEEQHIHAFTVAQGEVKERKKNMLYNITVEIEDNPIAGSSISSVALSARR